MIKPSRYLLFIAFTIFPNLQIVPFDIGITLVGLFSWVGLFCFKDVLRPNKWILRAATIGSVVYCYMRFGTLADPAAATSLLCMVALLKIFETQTYRDAMVLLIVSQIVVMAYLVESYSLVASGYMVLSFFLCVYFMMELQRKKYFLKQNIVRWSDLFSLELMVALPLLVGLFVFFPRFSTRLGSGERLLQTVGFSERIELGEMAKLAQSNEVAFKVRFFSAPSPPASELYFRGAVLSRPVKMSWRKSSIAASYYTGAGADLSADYQVLLPPREHRNLFTLADAVFLQSNPRLFLLQRKSENIYFSSSPIDQNITYLVATQAREGREPSPEDLLVPEPMKPTLSAVSQSITATTEAGKIESILNYFKDNQFSYSTETPAYTSIAEFFSQRIGFCEHYASAFTLLARQQGIPSRVVVGFMGGEINPYDSTITVRDKFAHAWSEVYIKGRGWLRVDPTAFIYPQRMATLLATSTTNQQIYGSFFSQSLLFFESINNQFEMFLISYDASSPWGMVTRLNQYLKWNTLALFFVLTLCFLLFAVLLWWVWRLDGSSKDPLGQAYVLILEKLSRMNLEKQKSEGPLEYCMRVETTKNVPRLYGELIKRYITLRFAQPFDNKQAADLYRDVRALR